MRGKKKVAIGQGEKKRKKDGPSSATHGRKKGYPEQAQKKLT